MIKKENLKEAKKIYLTGIMSDFPSDERMPYSIYKTAIKNKTMSAYSFYINNKRQGYFITKEEKKIVFIVYLAISKNSRNSGYGSQMIKEIIDYFKNNQYIIIEVEADDGNKDEKSLKIIEKRNNFYYRNGFEKLSDINYKLFGVKYDLLVYRMNIKEVKIHEAINQMKSFYKNIAKNTNFFTIDIK